MPEKSRPSLFLMRLAPLLVLAIAPFVYPGIPFLDAESLLAADLHGHFRPIQSMYRWYMVRGTVPLWNPYAFAGWPAFASGEAAGFYLPSALPVLAMGAEMGLKVRLLLHLAMSALGFYALVRELRVGRAVALALGLNYLWAGHTITKAFLIPIGDIAAWAPWTIFLHLRYARSPSLPRWLACAAGGGLMLALFVPQIVIPTMLLAALAGGGSFLRIGPAHGKKPSPLAHALDRIVLPFLELAALVLMVRYPREGWRSAFTGLGREGFIIVGVLAVAWGAWGWTRGVRAEFRLRPMGRWLMGFAACWFVAAMLAAPQLGITAEMIPYSTQADLRYAKTDFFTGAQAYGCMQHFVETIAMCRVKETVNNMALGPGVLFLILTGIALGLHRRRRAAAWTLGGALAVSLVYFAAPGLLDLLVRLPFFSKFKGLARYLVFLNLFLFMLSGLAAQGAIDLAPRRWRSWTRRAVVGVLAMNLCFLLWHSHKYLERISAGEAKTIPTAVVERLRAELGPGERFLLDHTGFEGETTYLMDSIGYRLPGIPNYDPMRFRGYDAYLRVHNASLGANHDDYRKPLFAPAATPWTRALRARFFVFPPNAPPDSPLRQGAEVVPGAQGWRIYRDPEVYRAAWLEKEIDRAAPSPDSPEGFVVQIVEHSLHRIELRIEGAEPGMHLVYPAPQYPGWRTQVNGKATATKSAYGFLRAIPLETSEATVIMTYRPLGFRAGWCALVVGVGIVVFLGVEAARRRQGRLPAAPGRLVRGLAIAALLALPVGAQALFRSPDALGLRLSELAGAIVCVLAWAILFHRRVAPERTR